MEARFGLLKLQSMTTTRKPDITADAAKLPMIVVEPASGAADKTMTV